MRTAARLLVLSVFVLLPIGCPPNPPPTRAQCPTHPRCRIVVDANADLDLADDLRRARNELLFPVGQPPATTGNIFLYPPEVPPSGVRYRWDGEVRFCGDVVDPPAGDAEPDCDGTQAIPRVHFLGWWHLVPLDADCENFASEDEREIGAIYSCLHVGDRFADGNAEPRPVLRSEERLVFRLVHAMPTAWPAIGTPVWLDGVKNSTFAVELHSDVPIAFDDPSTPENEDVSLAGLGAYISAIDSAFELHVLPGDGVPLKYGVSVDGPMSGTHLDVISEFGEVAAQPHSVFVVSPGDPLGLYPFNDGCAYGPDDGVGSCTDFSAFIYHREQADHAGQDAIVVNDGDRIALDLDVEHNDLDHGAVKLDSGGGIGVTVGEVGRVDVTGSLRFGGNANASAIGVNPPAVACVDAEIVTVSAPCIEPHGSATAIVAPTCSCNGAACQGEPWGPPCTDP